MGELAEFCDLHFGIRELLKGRWRSGESGRQQDEPLMINSAVEEMLAGVCRASAERVQEWKQTDKTTDDLGWRSGIDGRDSADLIETCLDVSRDKEAMKRALLPVIDVLANAGATHTAAHLRVSVRNI